MLLVDELHAREYIKSLASQKCVFQCLSGDIVYIDEVECDHLQPLLSFFLPCRATFLVPQSLLLLLHWRSS